MQAFPWSLGEIDELVHAGQLPLRQVVRASSDAIQERDTPIRAVVYPTLGLAMKRAERLAKDQRELQAHFEAPGSRRRGPDGQAGWLEKQYEAWRRKALYGVPYVAKDIFDTDGIRTEWGAPTERGRTPERDSALVAGLETAGCVLMGKAHTTAYAYYDTGPTRNPRAPAHTPGGSSSGSAAAVAAGMVPLAIGSQTQGSVLRPASFCGVAGFKPTYGLLPLGGVMAFAPTLDHAGLFTATASDLAVAWRGLGFETQAEAPGSITVIDWPPRQPVDAPMAEAFDKAVRTLEAAGMATVRVERPALFDPLPDALHTVMAYEAAVEHGDRYREHGKRIGTKLADLLDEGLSISRTAYEAALGTLENARADCDEWVRQHPMVATPAAPGPAPAGLGSSGDPRCNAPFTALGVPAVSIPMPVDTGSLPLGMQLTAGRGCDAALLAAAAACERALAGRRKSSSA